MKAAALAILALATLAPGPGHAGRAPHVPAARLISAAKRAPLRLIDALEIYCDGDTPIGVWLRRFTAREALRVAWSAGSCELVNSLNPSDAGGDYCAQATLTLRHPRNGQDQPEIEIYLEDPVHGHPGAAYAFRASFDGVDGPDYIRSRKDFETEWRQRFKHTPPPSCSDDP